MKLVRWQVSLTLEAGVYILLGAGHAALGAAPSFEGFLGDATREKENSYASRKAYTHAGGCIFD